MRISHWWIRVGGLVMGIRFRIVVLLLWGITLHADYVRQVSVVGTTDTALITTLKERFTDSIVSTKNVESVLHGLRISGKIQAATHAFIPSTVGSNLRIAIMPNPIVQSVFIEGYPKKYPKLPIPIGEPLNYYDLQSTIDTINQDLIAHDYTRSSVKSAVMSPDGQLHYSLTMPRITAIEWSPLPGIPDDYITRDLVTRINQPFQQSHYDTDYNTLRSLALVTVTSAPQLHETSPEALTIRYALQPKKANRVDVGLEELVNNQGVAVFGRYQRHNTILFSDRIDVQVQLSYLNTLAVRTYAIGYHQPWLLNRYNVSATARLYSRYASEISYGTVYNAVRSGGTATLSKTWRLANLTLGSSIRFERVFPQFGNTFDPYSLHVLHLFLNQVQPSLNPTAGSSTRVAMEFGFPMGVPAAIPFSRLSLSHARYYAIATNQTLAGRVFGGIYKKSTNHPTLETEAFSLGGAQSLRGYPEFAFYGNYRASYNLEYRYTVTAITQAALFWDHGCIGNTTDTLSCYYGYGLGARFLNPVLPLRIDLGLNAAQNVMLHVGLSQTF
jgi:outer membrane protein assembly factor BamA